MTGPDLSMGSTLARNATWFAGTPAYIADSRTLSHAQLAATTGSCSRCPCSTSARCSWAWAYSSVAELPCCIGSSRHVFVTDHLPILPTGKVDKRLLRARYGASTAPAS